MAHIDYYTCDRCGAHIPHENQLLVGAVGEEFARVGDCCPRCKFELREIIAAYFRGACIIVQESRGGGQDAETTYKVAEPVEVD